MGEGEREAREGGRVRWGREGGRKGREGGRERRRTVSQPFSFKRICMPIFRFSFDVLPWESEGGGGRAGERGGGGRAGKIGGGGREGGEGGRKSEVGEGG